MVSQGTSCNESRSNKCVALFLGSLCPTCRCFNMFKWAHSKCADHVRQLFAWFARTDTVWFATSPQLLGATVAQVRSSSINLPCAPKTCTDTNVFSMPVHCHRVLWNRSANICVSKSSMLIWLARCVRFLSFFYFAVAAALRIHHCQFCVCACLRYVIWWLTSESELRPPVL
jgi:hypothetical protein